MKHKFTVNIVEVHHLPVEVEAENAQDARELVNEMLANEDEKINFDGLVYYHTMPMDRWPVQNGNLTFV
jgi:hypothetical protein